MKKTLLLLAMTTVSVLSCKMNTQQQKDQLQLMPEAPAWGALWQQRAAEYRALSFQAYNFARLSFDALERKPSGKPLAVVTDIDETVLDNSPYYIHQAIAKANYSDSTWVQWTKQVRADSVPGAPSFFKYAASKGATIYYVTNRILQDKAATIENLKKFGFPNADEEHLLLLETTSSKVARREKIAADYEIGLLLGDNLGDFSGLFDNHAEQDRKRWVEENRSQFGKKFIVLPNVMYGNWEDSWYGKKTPKSFTDSNTVLNGLMKDYK
ncbi:5'-nucleotidase, lipoprotein e(P4) family [Pedobacter frigidisoli]|uniref:5'-nucleotidase, lipoprotein e(P4) family n=1 Tax=Pedobacter frigidisoli TaxID=2530455 RepID=UPI00292D4454|nr:5'-nucleotidase, lipoprotein e(P4) family [Pedobacter frigidisoli]